MCGKLANCLHLGNETNHSPTDSNWIPFHLYLLRIFLRGTHTHINALVVMIIISSSLRSSHDIYHMCVWRVHDALAAIFHTWPLNYFAVSISLLQQSNATLNYRNTCWLKYKFILLFMFIHFISSFLDCIFRLQILFQAIRTKESHIHMQREPKLSDWSTS